MPKITIAQNILAANDTIAQEIQQSLAARGIRTINIMSSPGAGKTTLLERTLERLRGRMGIAVIEGDIETSADAERIEAAGAETVQINTRGACHLEAHMIRSALAELELEHIHLLIIENIGNLVCPSYPQMFAASQVMIVNKLDLLPYVDYDVAKVKRQALAINPHLQIFELSCRTGEGLDTWCEWLMAFVHGQVATTLS